MFRRRPRLTEADIEQTRQAALGLRKPDKYLPSVDVLRDGSMAIPRY